MYATTGFTSAFTVTIGTYVQITQIGANNDFSASGGPSAASLGDVYLTSRSKQPLPAGGGVVPVGYNGNAGYVGGRVIRGWRSNCDNGQTDPNFFRSCSTHPPIFPKIGVKYRILATGDYSNVSSDANAIAPNNEGLIITIDQPQGVTGTNSSCNGVLGYSSTTLAAADGSLYRGQYLFQEGVCAGLIYSVYYGGEGADYSLIGGPSSARVGDKFVATTNEIFPPNLLMIEYGKAGGLGYNSSHAIPTAMVRQGDTVLATFHETFRYQKGGTVWALEHDRYSTIIQNPETIASAAAQFSSQRIYTGGDAFFAGLTAGGDGTPRYCLWNRGNGNGCKNTRGDPEYINAATCWWDKFICNGKVFIVSSETYGSELSVIELEAPTAAFPAEIGSPFGKGSPFPDHRLITPDASISHSPLVDTSILSQIFGSFVYSQTGAGAKLVACNTDNPNFEEAPHTDPAALSPTPHAVITLDSNCTYALFLESKSTDKSPSTAGCTVTGNYRIRLRLKFGAFGP
jgi:hypothetical protein